MRELTGCCEDCLRGCSQDHVRLRGAVINVSSYEAAGAGSP